MRVKEGSEKAGLKPNIQKLKIMASGHTTSWQKATVRNGHGTMDWFQTGKGVHQGCIIVTLVI